MWRVNEHVRYLIEQLPELGGSQRLLIGHLAEDGSESAQQRAADLLRPTDGVAKARKAKLEEIQRLSEALLNLTGLSFSTVWFQEEMAAFRKHADALISSRRALLPRVPDMAILRQPAHSAGLCIRVGDGWIKGIARSVYRFANRQPASAEDRPPLPVIPADATNIWTEFRDLGAWLEQPANKGSREVRLIVFMLSTRRLMLDERGEVQGIFIVPTDHFGTLANARNIEDLRYQWETGRPDDKGVLVFNRGTGQIPCADRLEGADCEIYFIWTTDRIPTFDQRRDRISFTTDDLQCLLDALQRIPDRWTCDHLDFRVGPVAGRLSDGGE